MEKILSKLLVNWSKSIDESRYVENGEVIFLEWRFFFLHFFKYNRQSSYSIRRLKERVEKILWTFKTIHELRDESFSGLVEKWVLFL